MPDMKVSTIILTQLDFRTKETKITCEIKQQLLKQTSLTVVIFLGFSLLKLLT